MTSKGMSLNISRKRQLCVLDKWFRGHWKETQTLFLYFMRRASLAEFLPVHPDEEETSPCSRGWSTWLAPKAHSCVFNLSDLPGFGSSLPTADQLLEIHYTPSQITSMEEVPESPWNWQLPQAAGKPHPCIDSHLQLLCSSCWRGMILPSCSTKALSRAWISMCVAGRLRYSSESGCSCT